MKKKVLVLATLMAVMGASSLKAQLNVGSTSAPDASAILQLSSTTQGLRMPNVALTNTTTFAPVTTATSSAAAIGLSVYNTGTAIASTNPLYPTAGVGVYTWDGTGWIAGSSSGADLRAVNGFPNSSYNHITFDAGKGGTGTSAGYQSNIAIGKGSLNTIGTYTGSTTNGPGSRDNIAIGASVLALVDTGRFNVAIGMSSLGKNITDNNIGIGQSAGYNNTTGTDLIAIGNNAGYSNTTGGSNVSIGRQAGYANTSGIENTALGFIALINNQTGSHNTALGVIAGSGVTTGSYNTAVGYGAMSPVSAATTGSYNNAMGPGALSTLTTGSSNQAVGYRALYAATTGSYNTAMGDQSMASLTSGTLNTAFGNTALHNATSTSGNTAVGNEAWYHGTGTNNVALGYDAGSNVVAGDNNVSVGYLSMATQTSGSNNIALGYGANLAIATGSNQMNLGGMIAGAYIDGSGTGGNIVIGHGAGVLNGTITLDVAGVTNIRKAFALGTLALSGAATYTLSVTDVQYSVIKIASTITSLTLISGPAMSGAGYNTPDGQILRIINGSGNTVTIAGTNTDNATAVVLQPMGTAGTHGVEYIWGGASNAWFRMQ